MPVRLVHLVLFPLVQCVNPLFDILDVDVDHHRLTVLPQIFIPPFLSYLTFLVSKGLCIFIPFSVSVLSFSAKPQGCFAGVRRISPFPDNCCCFIVLFRSDRESNCMSAWTIVMPLDVPLQTLSLSLWHYHQQVVVPFRYAGS